MTTLNRIFIGSLYKGNHSIETLSIRRVEGRGSQEIE